MNASDSHIFTHTHLIFRGEALFETRQALFETRQYIVMARRSDSSSTFRNDPQLQQYFLEGVAPTGKTLGVGSYGSVVEVKLCIIQLLS